MSKPKKRKLKCSVKLFLVSVLFVVSLLLVFQKNKQNKALMLTNNQIVLKNKGLEKDLKQVTFERDFPQQTYATKVNEQLKKEDLFPYLILQTDERYDELKYGWGSHETLGVNGCAITSLAIIESIHQKKLLEPQVVLNWANNDFFTDEGTSWSIFPAFAKEFGYDFEDLGDNIDNAIRYLDKGVPVVVSAKPGLFTTVGHIMVLTDYTEDGIRLLDPNDTAKKNHALTGFDPEEIENEFTHYWVFTKK